MYLGAHLHVHYSGAVKTDQLLDAIPLNKVYCTENKTLTYISQNCKFKPNLKNYDEIKQIIKDSWVNGNYDDKFNTIGNMMYEVIKNKEFYPIYLELIAADMVRQNIDHAEYRLVLGGMFYYDASGARVRCSIEEELGVLNNFRQSKLPNLSIAFIAQYSKHKPISVAFSYFGEIGYTVKKRGYNYLIVGFDLVGNEDSSKALNTYKLTNIGNIPYMLHAGENNTPRCMQNVAYALACNIHLPRIGHGIYKSQASEQAILDRGIILEFCPLSMKLLNHWNESYIKKYILSHNNYCINADDPNKLHDTDLIDNFKFISQYITPEQVAIAVHNSIMAAMCSPETRQMMLDKWKRSYAPS